MQRAMYKVIKAMIDARQREANRQIADMDLATYAGAELDDLRPLIHRRDSGHVSVAQGAVSAAG